MEHFISATCEGEKCSLCESPATHKISEEIAYDDIAGQYRLNFSAYVCCVYFEQIFGAAVLCKKGMNHE